MKFIKKIIGTPGRYGVSGAPEGGAALLVAAAQRLGGQILYIAPDDRHAASLLELLAFVAPDVERLAFPAWDCLPYDRISPNAAIIGRRIDCLCSLLERPEAPRVVVSTAAAVLQRVPPRAFFAGATRVLSKGGTVSPDALAGQLTEAGYLRTQTVREPGEFAVRGGIVDLFPAGGVEALRLDFFGDVLDAIRTFDVASQRTTGSLDRAALRPVSEIPLDAEAVSRFRSGYRALFGGTRPGDYLYEAVSEGRHHAGVEHWSALFHEGMETLFDYLPGVAVVLGHETEQAFDARLDQIAEYYAARLDPRIIGAGGDGASVYHPVPPERLYLDRGGLTGPMAPLTVISVSPFTAPEGAANTFDAGCRLARDFADARVRQGKHKDANVFDAVVAHLDDAWKRGQRTCVACYTEGSRRRLAGLLSEHGVETVRDVDTLEQVGALGMGVLGLAVVALERGFETDHLMIVGEQDILGERMSRSGKRSIKPENFIAEATSLNEGDLVVHAEHGIARFDGLETIQVSNAPHDCLRLVYSGGDKLFLPVENIEILSRYGADGAGASLDRLGGAAWQARKARLKDRIREMAGQLIQVAAARQLRPAMRMVAPPGLLEEFSAAFPYTETDDQARAIDDTLADLASGRAADRLVCGDVGFGKTEIALRAAFVAAMSGRQVAVVVPTTLLARQHFKLFSERFAEYPVRVEQLSRLVTPKAAAAAKAGLTDGTVDIVIGTHALLAGDVKFRDLGLLVIDEEQHFGVAHKEKLKRIKADVHVLTLTATPIPRTLQLALTGVRELSLIATPPVDRLAVRTFVLPFDAVVVREAIMRERFRGGQTFYVCPRVSDLGGIAKNLAELVPEARVAKAHGQLSSGDLEQTMERFYDGAFDVLLATNIVESGLDLPSVNTIIIHRADMFGLSQLYQLRGRVGRSKARAYAYLTLPPNRKLTPAAEKRLEIMQTLDSLGAGFSLASHDLDTRGAGNLLGEEQSGHIREVGFELYQHMLEEAVAEARGLDGGATDDDWSPQITVGLAVLIPDFYVTDLGVRMDLYRRIAGLADGAAIDGLAAELIDRFGPLPESVENLLALVAVKQLCRAANVEKVDAGPKGAVVAFRGDHFANPAGLVQFINDQKGTAKLRPDHRLVHMRGWPTPRDRLLGVERLLGDLARLSAA